MSATTRRSRCSGRRSTTRRARPSTRARGCSASATRAAREIDRLARDGDPEAFSFPVARVPGLDFSFSGLKTALLYTVRDLGEQEARAAARRPRRVLPAGDRPRARRADAGGGGGDRCRADRGRRRRRRELRASRRPSRRRAGAARALHRQRGDDRLGRTVRRADRLPSVPCARRLPLDGSPSSACSRIVALAAAAISVAAATGGSSEGARAEPVSWRGLVGGPRPEVPVGQRMIVVLRTPSLADAWRAAGGRASEANQRRWHTAAQAAQRQLIARLSVAGPPAPARVQLLARALGLLCSARRARDRAAPALSRGRGRLSGPHRLPGLHHRASCSSGTTCRPARPPGPPRPARLQRPRRDDRAPRHGRPARRTTTSPARCSRGSTSSRTTISPRRRPTPTSRPSSSGTGPSSPASSSAREGRAG